MIWPNATGLKAKIPNSDLCMKSSAHTTLNMYINFLDRSKAYHNGRRVTGLLILKIYLK